MQKLIFIILLFLLTLLNVTGQELNNLLLSNQQVDKKVLELTIAPQFDNNYFIVGIVINNQVIAKDFYAKTGKQVYDLRNLPEWKGKIDHIATNLPRQAIQSSRLITPSFLDELKLVLVTEQFSPRIINFQKPRTFLGVPIAYSLLAILLIVLGGFYFFGKKTLLLSAFIGFTVSSLFLDIKNIFDHKKIINYTEKTYPYIAPLTIPQKFLQQANPIIGANYWTFQGKISEEYYKLFIKYELADRFYVPNTGKLLPKGTYIITESPKRNQEVLVQESNLYLVTTKE